MKKLKLKLGNRSYPIIIGFKVLTKLASILKHIKIGKDAVIITNPSIWSRYGNELKRILEIGGFSARCESVPPGETSKSSKLAAKLAQKISRFDKRRGTFIVAFGGGVVGDLAGFVACFYKRGVPYIQIPTTLLAQVDSAIGGKVAVDLETAKNIVGAFYQPKLVISDTSFLRSLPKRQIISGLAEIIKYGVIADERLFSFIEHNLTKIVDLDNEALEYVIYRSSKIKARIVERDERDRRGIRAVLNYGHTVGHAIEVAAGFSSKLYTHGEAIAIGMIVASNIACRLGMLEEKVSFRIESLIKKAGLPAKIRSLNLEDIMEAQTYDKKIIHGVNRFVLPTGIGRMRICEDIPKKLIIESIRERR